MLHSRGSETKPCWDFYSKSQLSHRNALPIYIALKTRVVCTWQESVKINCSYMSSLVFKGSFKSVWLFSLLCKLLTADTRGECNVFNSTAIMTSDETVIIWKQGNKKKSKWTSSWETVVFCIQTGVTGSRQDN